MRVSKYPTLFPSKTIQEFYERCPISTKYKPKTELVEVTKNELEDLSARIEPSRHAFRKHKQIDTKQSHAIIIPDYSKLIRIEETFDDVQYISIELKPKCGFIPDSNSIACRFCMHQTYKQFLDPDVSISRYCPIDLFSRDRERMKRAVKELCIVPGNNLRVHVNGMIVDVGYGIRCIKECFGVGLVDACVDIMLRETVLDEILELQKLDQGIEKVYELFMEFSQSDEHKSVIEDFVEAVTYKDCSIMISLGRMGDAASQGVILNEFVTSGHDLVYHVVALDIDPKCASKIPAYCRLDREINAYFESQNIIKHCS